MNEKSVRLVVIVIVTFVLLNLAIVVVPNIFGTTSAEEEIKALAPFVFVLGLVTPVIFITQFPHKEYYKYFGVFLIVMQFIRLFSDYSFTFESYTIIQVVKYILMLLGYIVFLVLALISEDMKKTSIYLIVLIVALLYTNHWLLEFFLRSEFSTFVQVILRILIPLVFSFATLILKCVVIVHESNKEI